MKTKLEAYPKSSVLKYWNGWFITSKGFDGIRRKVYGPYKSKELAEPDRLAVNDKLSR